MISAAAGEGTRHATAAHSRAMLSMQARARGT
jgi:hypothetical protein